MLKRGQRLVGTVKGKHEAELLRLSTLVEEMRREFSTQKQELEYKIGRLEEELSQTRRIAQGGTSQPEAEEPPTSRRTMLKRLGAAAAGVAVASVAAGIGQEAQPAYASSAWLVPTGSDSAITTQGVNTTGLTTPPTGPAFNTLNIQNQFTGGVNADAIVATSTSGVALNAFSTSGTSAVLGVQNLNSSINNAVSTNNPSLTTTAGVTGSSDSAFGVAGLSSTHAGIFGFGSGSGGYGGMFQVATTGATPQVSGSGPLLIVPEPQSGPPTTTGIFHNAGELHVDSVGDLWLCKISGTTGGVPLTPAQIRRLPVALSPADQQRLLVGATPTWVKVNGGGGGGTTINFLSTPVRVVGQGTAGPNGLPTPYPNYPPVTGNGFNYIPSYFLIEGTWGGQTIPSNAIGVIGFFTHLGATSPGFAAVYPANSTPPGVSTLNYPGNSVLTTTVIVKLGAIPASGNRFPADPAYVKTGKQGIAVTSFTSAQVALDVVGYLT